MRASRQERLGGGWRGFLFVVPHLVLFIVFVIIPIFYGLYISLTKWDLSGAPQFVGLQNYRVILFNKDSTFNFQFFNGMKNTLLTTYFGMRKVEVVDGWVLLNNQPLYQRLVLDQGYWPESLLTPPSDEAIKADVEWTKKLGYNGARKHQKLEDPRYCYWADVLGLLVWGEIPSTYEFTDESVDNMSATLSGFIDRDYNHPSLVCWVPLNESWGVNRIYKDKRMQACARMLYHQAKAQDGTRIVSINDGWEQVDTDIIALHDYSAAGAVIAKHFTDRDEVLIHTNDCRMACADFYKPTSREAIMVTEYGGIAFQDKNNGTWGYGDKVKDEEAFFTRYKDVTDSVRAIPFCQGFCYTQLTDVQQETNGLLTPDRKPKVDVERFRAFTTNPLGR